MIVKHATSHCFGPGSRTCRTDPKVDSHWRTCVIHVECYGFPGTASGVKILLSRVKILGLTALCV